MAAMSQQQQMAMQQQMYGMQPRAPHQQGGMILVPNNGQQQIMMTNNQQQQAFMAARMRGMQNRMSNPTGQQLPPSGPLLANRSHHGHGGLPQGATAAGMRGQPGGMSIRGGNYTSSIMRGNRPPNVTVNPDGMGQQGTEQWRQMMAARYPSQMQMRQFQQTQQSAQQTPGKLARPSWFSPRGVRGWI